MRIANGFILTYSINCMCLFRSVAIQVSLWLNYGRHVLVVDARIMLDLIVMLSKPLLELIKLILWNSVIRLIWRTVANRRHFILEFHIVTSAAMCFNMDYSFVLSTISAKSFNYYVFIVWFIVHLLDYLAWTWDIDEVTAILRYQHLLITRHYQVINSESLIFMWMYYATVYVHSLNIRILCYI